MRKWISLAMLCLLFTGCADISPLSPDLKQQIDNQDGKIEDIRNNQNGFMAELLKLRQQNEIMARDIKNFQQGLINMNKSNENFGIQILQGDGGLIFAFSLAVIAMLLIYHYRQEAKKSEKTADVLAQQIALYDDINLNNEVFLAAMNTEAEEEVYRLITAHQRAP